MVVTRFSMRAGSVVESLSPLAVPAEHLQDRRIAVAFAPLVCRDAASAFVALEGVAPPLGTIVIDVIERQKRKLSFSTAGTECAAIGRIGFQLQFEAMTSSPRCHERRRTTILNEDPLIVATRTNWVQVSRPALKIKVSQRPELFAACTTLAVGGWIRQQAELADRPFFGSFVEVGDGAQLATRGTRYGVVLRVPG